MSTLLQRNIALFRDTYKGEIYYTDYFTPTGTCLPPETALPNDINLLIKDEQYYVIIKPDSVIYPGWENLSETMPMVNSMMHLKPNRCTSPTHMSQMVVKTVRLIERVYCTTLEDIWEGIPKLVASPRMTQMTKIMNQL
jgi:hypothetical protein